MHITMFLKDGKTLRFERITNLKKEFPFDNIITFNYLSASDGKQKRALFNLKDILGFSVDDVNFDVKSLY
nr:MAG TPA: hypothetical protein [Caudoviricetes sp.]